VSATRILWGQIVIVSLIVLVAIWTATQWTAPLWTVAENWGWGIDDASQALGLVRRFGSVTVLNGHIWRLGFPPQLGGPSFYILPGMPVYLSQAFFWWWLGYDAYAPRIFLEGACIAASGGLLAAAAAFTLSIWRARDRAVETYGSARWAKQVRRAGLLGPDGIVLGRCRGAFLRHDGPEHVLCFAPTRSGKGVGLVVPSLVPAHGL
jgi:type IV secretion system protein VirD4